MLVCSLTLLASVATCSAAASVGTAFSYQGSLASGGSPASGVFDIQFALYDAASGGNQIGSLLTNTAVSMSDGSFAVSLDFGANAFQGNPRWLEISVRRSSAGGVFTTLTPRQSLMPVPYALFAPSAGNASSVTANAVSAASIQNAAITAGKIASGQVVKSLNGLADNVALAAGANVSLATNGNTLTLSASGGGATGGWSTTGNAGTTPPANFLGTTDGKPLLVVAGTVGINRTNPAATLDVNGAVLAASFAGDGSGLTNVIAGTLATPFTLAQSGATNDLGPASGVAVSGQYAYVAAGADGQLYVYDVSNPANPLRVAQLRGFPWDPQAVTLSGNYAFVAAGSLCTVDVSSPANPVMLHSGGNFYETWGVAVTGQLACLAAGQDGLFLYDVTDPSSPVGLSHVTSGAKAMGVAISGSFVYLANGNDGLRIYNVSNPAKPVNVSHVSEALMPLGAADGIAVAGGYAYLANDFDGLRIYDVSNPTNPVFAGQIAESDNGCALGAAISGAYAFLANSRQGLHVYNVSTPATPADLGVVPPAGNSGYVAAVAVQGDYAYVANDLGGFSVCFAAPLAQVAGVVAASALLGDGSGLTNLNAGQLTGQFPPGLVNNLWQLGGNAGTTPGKSFLGTTDTEPLDLGVDGASALRLMPGPRGAPSVIGGASVNYITPGVAGSVIAGGGATVDPWDADSGPVSNAVLSSFSSIGGGLLNTIQTRADYSFLGGGSQNTIQDDSYDCFLGGGQQNTIQTNSRGSVLVGGQGNSILTNAWDCFLGGGSYNVIGPNALGCVLAGGTENTNAGTGATIPGGSANLALGINSFAAGYRAKATNDNSFVWADSQEADFGSTAADQFSVRARGGVAFATGGAGLTVDGQPVLAAGGGLTLQQNADGAPNVIAGSSWNFVAKQVEGATISGGGATNYSGSTPLTNSVTGDFGTVGGGEVNSAGPTATVAGGQGNAASGQSSTVGGGMGNTASGDWATLAGGENNTASGQNAAVGGGMDNSATDSSAAVGGGEDNTATNFAATVVGGTGNTAGGYAATVGGGSGNTAAGDYSFAGGYGADAEHAGCFVWADSTGGTYPTSVKDTFLVRATGGAFFSGDLYADGALVTHGSFDAQNIPGASFDQDSGDSTSIGGSSEFTLANCTCPRPAAGLFVILATAYVELNQETCNFYLRDVTDPANPHNLAYAIVHATIPVPGCSIAQQMALSWVVPITEAGPDQVFSLVAKAGAIVADSNEVIDRNLTVMYFPKWMSPSGANASRLPAFAPPPNSIVRHSRPSAAPGAKAKATARLGGSEATIRGLQQKLDEELERRDAENAQLKARLEKLERRLNGLNQGGH